MKRGGAGVRTRRRARVDVGLGRAACRFGVGLFLALAFGCGGHPSEPDVITEPILIDSVAVTVGPGRPAAVQAHVQGVLGDGCASLHSVTQARVGSTVSVTILRQRPADAVCIQIALLYDARIPLDGSFAQGAYVLRVNDTEQAFVVP